MKTALKVLGIIGIVIGGLAVLGASTEAEPGYAIIGGGLFLAYGILMVNAAKRIQ